MFSLFSSFLFSLTRGVYVPLFPLSSSLIIDDNSKEFCRWVVISLHSLYIWINRWINTVIYNLLSSIVLYRNLSPSIACRMCWQFRHKQHSTSSQRGKNEEKKNKEAITVIAEKMRKNWVHLNICISGWAEKRHKIIYMQKLCELEKFFRFENHSWSIVKITWAEPKLSSNVLGEKNHSQQNVSNKRQCFACWDAITVVVITVIAAFHYYAKAKHQLALGSC